MSIYGVEWSRNTLLEFVCFAEYVHFIEKLIFLNIWNCVLTKNRFINIHRKKRAFFIIKYINWKLQRRTL